MPLAKLRQEYEPLQPQPPLTARIDGAAAIASPARALQQQLEMQTGLSVAHDVDRWSSRRSLAFIVTSAAALWMAILMAAAEAARMIA